ncbi:MAG: hypothetical protein KDD21_09920 [Bacteroidetes bacterium]|nr:hypothetical protein [Bacteroidota bacterium]
MTIKKETLYDVLYLLILSATCHFLFSKYGFNPTDEGFVLSATNRVLHGQIPHVDFSSVRPLGYAYLHISELLISKNYFFLISRFVFWLEQVCIAYLWVRFIIQLTEKKISLSEKYFLIFIGFVFNVHYFPASVLHTIDGLLMCLLGLNLIISTKKWNFLGYFMIGFAALCKQNFLIVLPVCLVLFNRKDFRKNIIVGILPIFIYVVIISIYGGFNDLIIQLSGHNELIKVGILSYIQNPFFYVGILIFFFINYIFKQEKIIFYFSILIAMILLVTFHFHGRVSFIFFGILLADLIQSFFQKKENKILLILLVLSWSVSISVGYNTPALCIGNMLVYFTWKILPIDKKIIPIISLLVIIAFIYARLFFIYKDADFTKLKYKLNHIVEGANGIYTNKNTYQVLVELDSIKQKNPSIIFLPDFTACRILHSHQSPILTEWPNKTEIPNQKILEKVTSKLMKDSTSIIAISKYETSLLKDGFIPLESKGMDYPIIKLVKENYYKFDETTFFELYRK